MAGGRTKDTGNSQSDQTKEMLAQVLEEFRREMHEMRITINNLQSELTSAREEIKSLTEKNKEAEHQITIQREGGYVALEGNASGPETLADILRKSSEAMDTVREVAMQAATSQEAARCTSQLLERKRSVVVVGIKEQEGSNRQEWNRKDREAVHGILKGLRIEGAEQNIEKVFRLGWYNKDRNRLVKVVFTNETTKEAILERKSQLQYVEEYKKVFLQRDRTKEERARAAEARRKRRERGVNQEITAPNTTVPETRGEPTTSTPATPEGRATAPPSSA